MSVKDFGICDNTWKTLATNRSAWREQRLPVELTVQRPDDWMKQRRNVLSEKPEPEALLHWLRTHMSDLWERLSCSDRTPQPPPHSSPAQHFQLTKSRGHLRVRRTNIITTRRPKVRDFTTVQSSPTSLAAKRRPLSRRRRIVLSVRRGNTSG